jgi:hypothetical protein
MSRLMIELDVVAGCVWNPALRPGAPGFDYDRPGMDPCPKKIVFP